jgi:hypothetical protein
MSRNEIRLRRAARGADRFRNYGAVLQRHERDTRLKQIIRVFTLFAIVLVLVMLIIIVTRIEKRTQSPQPTSSTFMIQDTAGET